MQKSATPPRLLPTKAQIDENQSASHSCTGVNKISTRDFIQQKFAEYYSQNLNSVQPPTALEKREFAFLLFKEKTMMRHKGFKTTTDLRDMLMNVVPSDVYYSSAYYEKPEENMDAKGWIGADLIFDIDADHIPTPCNKQHDTWTCKNCGTSGRGAKPQKCPQCATEKFDDLSWPCETCLERAKEETIKLIDVLDSDFGLTVNEMNIAFSGHRGYHVHVENETIRTLDSMARKEIVDFLMGIGLEPKLFSIAQGEGPRLEDPGWKGRVAKGTYEFLLTATTAQLENAGLKKKNASRIIDHREKILESWKEKGPWKLLKNVGHNTWEKIIEQAIEKQSVRIDTVVTTDIHRLIRLTNTLHGETGLLKIELSANSIEEFDPFRKAVAFKHGTITVDVSDAPQFRLEDNTYGPYKNQRIELPTAAAMMLLCKGAAKTVEEKTLVQ